VFLLLSFFPTLVYQLAAKMCIALVSSSAYYSCGLVKPFHPKISGETNSSTSSISRTRSKCCNPQNMSSMQLLLCSTLEYHTLLYQEVVPSLMTFLMKWCSYTSLLTLSLSWSCLECWLCILLWPSEISSKSYCFEIQGPLHLAWLVNRSLSEVWLCCQVYSGTHLQSKS
jgi:hypothetical protein